MDVELIAWTEFRPPKSVRWDTDAHDGGSALAEFAGRACYESWSKPNPATATNADYLRHILEVGHLSVLEHGTATFYITGVSRNYSHEQVRHRHFGYSQRSQRYVPEGDARMVAPDLIAQAGGRLLRKFNDATRQALRNYEEILELCEEEVSDRHDLSRTEMAKAAREAARSVLPGATETRIVVSGNYRSWRHFTHMRATRHADVEIRRVAVTILRQLQGLAPNVFGDFVISALPDGTEVAASNLLLDD